MGKSFAAYLEVKTELDAGRITRRTIPGGTDWFDADEAEYQLIEKKKPKQAKVEKEKDE